MITRGDEEAGKETKERNTTKIKKKTTKNKIEKKGKGTEKEIGRIIIRARNKKEQEDDEEEGEEEDEEGEDM